MRSTRRGVEGSAPGSSGAVRCTWRRRTRYARALSELMDEWSFCAAALLPSWGGDRTGHDDDLELRLSLCEAASL